jgi:hypothetical protein
MFLLKKKIIYLIQIILITEPILNFYPRYAPVFNRSYLSLDIHISSYFTSINDRVMNVYENSYILDHGVQSITIRLLKDCKRQVAIFITNVKNVPKKKKKHDSPAEI